MPKTSKILPDIKKLFTFCLEDGCTPAQAATDLQSLLSAIARQHNDQRIMKAAVDPRISQWLTKRYYLPMLDEK